MEASQQDYLTIQVVDLHGPGEAGQALPRGAAAPVVADDFGRVQTVASPLVVFLL